MKKPFLYAFGAAVYIVAIVLIINSFRFFLPNENMIIPMLMLSLFVLSAAVMGFLFLSEPLYLYLENRKQEAIVFFAKIVGVFACFVVIFFVLCLIWGGNNIGVNTNTGNNSLQVYKNASKGFSISYPKDYVINESYVYQALGPGKDIKGVKLTVPAALANGTNLGSDSYISVESLPGGSNSCSMERFLDNPKLAGFVDENGRRYSIATSTGAAAGNRYEETVYTTLVQDGCLAIRYFIHYSVFENYPAGTVRQFDKQALFNQFDKIRQTLIINK